MEHKEIIHAISCSADICKFSVFSSAVHVIILPMVANKVAFIITLWKRLTFEFMFSFEHLELVLEKRLSIIYDPSTLASN